MLGKRSIIKEKVSGEKHHKREKKKNGKRANIDGY